MAVIFPGFDHRSSPYHESEQSGLFLPDGFNHPVFMMDVL